MDPRVTAALKVEDEKYNAGTIGGEKYVNLRDEFATAILPAIYTDAIKINLVDGFTNPEWRQAAASEAYRIADAMLAARNA